MRVLINRQAVNSNIKKAKTLAHNVPVSLLFKDFYEDIADIIEEDVFDVFAMHRPLANCYSIGRAKDFHTGTVVTSVNQIHEGLSQLKRVFIPINMYDNREGLTVERVRRVAKAIKKTYPALRIFGLVTSGCLNERAPSVEELWKVWDELSDVIYAISLGGSFWLGKDEALPPFVRDIRIGEYMLFGTIPYDSDKKKQGTNAITIEATVIGVYPERNHILIDCGYSIAEPDKCEYPKDVFYVDSSSEYTILYTKAKYVVGNKIMMKPNYKSLVKLRDAVRDYI